MNDTPISHSDRAPSNLDAAIDQLGTLDPADAAVRAEEIAQELAKQLDPPNDAELPAAGTPDS